MYTYYFYLNVYFSKRRRVVNKKYDVEPIHYDTIEVSMFNVEQPMSAGWYNDICSRHTCIIM